MLEFVEAKIHTLNAMAAVVRMKNLPCPRTW